MTGRTADRAPDWTADDEAAVRVIYHEVLAESPEMKPGSAWFRAARSHYSRTGRLKRHNSAGYSIGCRCPACREAAARLRKSRSVVGAAP